MASASRCDTFVYAASKPAVPADHGGSKWAERRCRVASERAASNVCGKRLGVKWRNKKNLVGGRGESQRQTDSDCEVVTDTFNGSGTQKALPTRPPVEHEATRGV